MALHRVSPVRRRLAQLQERDRRKIEIIGERVSGRIAPEINARILTSFAAGQDPIPVMHEQLVKQFMPLVQKAMVAAHLTGRLRSARSAAPTLRKRRTMSAYDDALAYLEKRLALSPEQMQHLMEVYGNESVNVTRNLGAAVEAKVQTAMEEILRSGAHVQEAVAMLRAELGPDQGLMSASLMNTLVRTQTQMAYSAGRWNANQDAAIQEILWGKEYVTVGDDRVRPTHQAMDGVRMPKNDPRWDEWTPPAGFNCRCSTIDVFNEDKEASIVDIPASFTADNGEVITDIRPDPDWRFNPGKVFSDLIGAATP